MNIYEIIRSFFSILEKRHKVSFLFMIFFVFIASSFEAISVVMVIPLAEAALGITNNTGVGKSLSNFLISNDLPSGRNAIIYWSIFIFTFVAFLRLATLWVNIKLGFLITRHLSKLAFAGALSKRPKTNVTLSQVGTVVTQKVNSISNQIILSSIFATSSFISLIILFCVTVLYAPKLFIKIFVLLGLSYILLSIFSKTKLRNLGIKLNKSLTEINALVIASFANRNFIAVNDTTDQYIKRFKNVDKEQKDNLSIIRMITDSPKILIELFLILSLLLSFLLISSSNLINLLPSLGITLLAAAKILPQLQTLFRSVALISNAGPIYEEYLTTIKQDNAKSSRTGPLKTIENKPFKNLTVEYVPAERYQDCRNKIEFSLTYGQSLCLHGPSGFGKTTFLNSLVGLENEDDISIHLDGKKVSSANDRNWQSRITYLEQGCWLIPGSVEENILFGNQKKTNHQFHLSRALTLSGLQGFAAKTDICDTNLIGDNNAGVSGGEARRIFLARALYDLKEILVIDEPTTGLDDKTSSYIFDTLTNLGIDVTVICVSHDIVNYEYFDEILSIGGKHR